MGIQRDVAFKVRIKDITGGEFVKSGEKFDYPHIVTPLKEEVSRVRVLGTVVSKFISDDERYGSITLDDCTDTVAVRTFGEDVRLIGEIEAGDIVDLIGRVKEYNDERYINLESVRRIDDPNWELVRRLELIRKIQKLGGNAQAIGENALEKTDAESENSKIKVLNLVEEMDEGGGVKYVALLNESGLNEEKFEKALNNLMDSGEIYEPKIGRFKRV